LCIVATVVFDVRANHDTGISRYGFSVLAAAAPYALDSGWRLIAVAWPWQENQVRRAVAHLGIPVFACPDDQGFIRDSPWLRAQLRRQRADLYYTAHYTVDRQCPVPFVYTIHDLTRLRYPALSYSDADFAKRFGHRELDAARRELAVLSGSGQPGAGPVFSRYFRELNHYLAERAQRIVTISRSTAGDIKCLLGVSDARLDLIPGGVDGTVFHPRGSQEVGAVAARHGLHGPYVLYTGLVHPNKRVEWLLERLVEARAAFPAGARLVVAGGHAEKSMLVRQIVTRGQAEDFVVFAGRVDDDELAALYTGASAYVTAAVSEGFGLPMLEARACGAHVIGTDIPALRETLAGAAHFYRPGDASRLVALVADALSGRLPRIPSGPLPFAWESSGELLVRALARAMT
jgi:glycosyltransferase involved in cell wall biosynthesis